MGVEKREQKPNETARRRAASESGAVIRDVVGASGRLGRDALAVLLRFVGSLFTRGLLAHL